MNFNENKNKKILVIGLGQIGYSNAEYMTSLGLKPDGFDIFKTAVDRAINNGVIAKEATNFADYDFYLICVSTHNPSNMFVPFLDGVYEIAHRLEKEGKPGALIGIDSTIPRGTSNKIKDIVKHKLHVAHVPHRLYVPDKHIHGVNCLRVLGVSDECCKTEALKYYQDLLKIPLHPVGSIEVAELTKTIENSHRYLEIAFAEELKMMCDSINIDFDDLRKAMNTKWNVNLPEAQGGIGGHCLPKDSEMVLELNREAALQISLLDTAKKIDSKYREHVGPDKVKKSEEQYMIDQTPRSSILYNQ
jgi:UDP-N-acetyl-D-mannosaminuronic acid dehydrogenase